MSLLVYSTLQSLPPDEGFNLQLVQQGKVLSPPLATLPLGFRCGFVSASACEWSTGLAPEAALEGVALPQGGGG